VSVLAYNQKLPMRETVSIHVGQCGNQIGNQFWNLLLHEHEKTPDDDESLSAFFRFAPQRNGSVAMKARALLIDMECGPLQETMRGPLGSLFDDTQFVMDVSGAGNNFAQGHYMYGPQYRERFIEGVRRNAEQCDSLQTFLVTHSLGGGTGSGVGTYVLGMLSDEFPKICRFSTCVYPSENNDVIVSPYNVMLATSQLIEHADCVFPLDNAALFSFAQRERSGRKGGQQQQEREEQQAAMLGNRKKDKDRGFDAINGVAARMLCHLTSSSRFPGEMNVDLNEIYTNLVPYPRLHFLVTALSLQEPPQQQHAPGRQSVAAGAAGKL
jgi:tubulin epsilon